MPAQEAHEESVRSRMRSALTAAMKARDRDGVRALRTALGAIDNAEAVDPAAVVTTSGPIAGAARGLGAAEVPRRELTEADMIRIVRQEIHDRLTTAAEFENAGQTDAGTTLRAEARCLEAVLAARG